MKLDKKNIICYLMIFFLLVLNGKLLFDKVRQIKAAVGADIGNKFIKTGMAYSRMEDYILSKPFSLFIKKEISELIPANNDRYHFIFLFRRNDCTHCLAQEIDKINELDLDKLKYGISVTGLFVSDSIIVDAVFIRKHKINFTCATFSEKLFPDKTPLILILGDHFSVLDAYIPEPDNIKKRDAFYQKWSNILAVR